MLSKFEASAIARQEQAYQKRYADFQFNKSCEICASRNLRSGKGTCVTCPIKGAYEQALKEIESGERTGFNLGVKVFVSKSGVKTLTLN